MSQISDTEKSDIEKSIAITVVALYDAATKLLAWAADPVNIDESMTVDAQAQTLVANAAFLDARLVAIKAGIPRLKPPSESRIANIAMLTDEVLSATTQGKRVETILNLADKAFDLGLEANAVGRA